MAVHVMINNVFIGVFTSPFVRWLVNIVRGATHWLKRLPWERLDVKSRVREMLHDLNAIQTHIFLLHRTTSCGI